MSNDAKLDVTKGEKTICMQNDEEEDPDIYERLTKLSEQVRQWKYATLIIIVSFCIILTLSGIAIIVLSLSHNSHLDVTGVLHDRIMNVEANQLESQNSIAMLINRTTDTVNKLKYLSENQLDIRDRMINIGNILAKLDAKDAEIASDLDRTNQSLINALFKLKNDQSYYNSEKYTSAGNPSIYTIASIYINLIVSVILYKLFN